MSDQVVEVKDDADEMASVMAGYNKEARTEEVPAEERTEPEQPVEQEVETEPTEAEKIAAELTAIKSQISAIKSQSDPAEVRKLYGEIGNINRTLKQMQPKEPPPEPDEYSLAMQDVEKVASEFEELGRPIVRAIKAVAARPTTSAPEVDIDAKVTERVEALRRKEAIEILADEHPDWQEKRNSKEFNEWLSAKPQEYQHKLMNSTNPLFVSKGLTEFSESLKSREKKQNRLAAAVTPQGVPSQPRSSVLPDEEGFSIGYNRGPKRLNSR